MPEQTARYFSDTQGTVSFSKEKKQIVFLTNNSNNLQQEEWVLYPFPLFVTRFRDSAYRSLADIYAEHAIKNSLLPLEATIIKGSGTAHLTVNHAIVELVIPELV